MQRQRPRPATLATAQIRAALILAALATTMGWTACSSDDEPMPYGTTDMDIGDAVEADSAVPSDTDATSDPDVPDTAEMDTADSDAEEPDTEEPDGGDTDTRQPTDTEDADVRPEQQRAGGVQIGLDIESTAVPRFLCHLTPSVLIDPDALYPCPQIGEDWAVEPVFLNTLEFDVLLTRPDEGFGRYCLYEWQGEDSPSSEEQLELLTEALDSDGQDDNFLCEGDLPIVVPLAIDTAPATATSQSPELYVATAQQAGAVETCPATNAASGAPVTVAVIDSVPSPTSPFQAIGLPRDATSRHGTAMGALIRDFSGPAGAGCRAQILHTLALDLIREDGAWVVDRENGGYVGTVAGLARATWQALAYWRVSTLFPDSDSRLVLNYSVGWDFELAPSSLATNVIEGVLERATAEGALVLAATGNRVAGPDEGSGPMMPAALEIGPGGKPCATDPCPLRVRAVGAVESDTELLSLMRPESAPGLVAWGHYSPFDSAHVEDFPAELAPDDLAALAGTSVSTALASAAAAAVWSANPEWEADAVYEALRSTGTPFGGLQADFCPATGAPEDAVDCEGLEVRRLSICRAVSPATPDACEAPTVDAADAIAQSIENARFDVSMDHEVTAIWLLSAPCGPDYTLRLDGSEAPPWDCPERQITGYERQALVYPQPGVHGCDNCLLDQAPDGSWTVSLFANPELKGGLSHPRLVLIDPQTDAAVAVDLGLDALAPKTSARIGGIDLTPIPFADTARPYLVSTTAGLSSRDAVSVDVLARK